MKGRTVIGINFSLSEQWQFAGREGVEEFSGQLSSETVSSGAQNLLVVHRGVKEHGPFSEG